MNKKWAYLNDIIGCKIIALYTMNALIEIVYQKEGHTRSLTINFHTEGGALGYIETLYCDSIPLPPAKIIHPLSHAFESLYDYNLYVRENGWEHYEELEFITDQGSFLLFFESDETQKVHAKMEKNRAPSLSLHVKQKAILPQELFSVDDFKAHLAFALQAHGEQKTPHGLPYSMHLLSVASEVINALYMEPLSYDENNVAIACALLHDVNEDTPTKITRETALVGHVEVIVKGVAALTKDKTLPSKEAQMQDSIARLKKRQNCVAMVKLADRITNLGVPPTHWDVTKKRAYLHEARFILNELGYAHRYLANKLAEKIKAYDIYM